MNIKYIFTILAIVILFIAIAASVGISASAETAEIPPAAEGEEIDVWLISGQSNAIGSAFVSNYPTDEAYAAYKEMLTAGSSNVWYFGNSSTQFVPSGFGLGSDSRYSGPEIGLTTALDGNGRMNAIIKQAHGNTSLYNNTTSNESKKFGTWTPPSYIEKHSIDTLGNRTGDLYLTFMQKVEDGLALLEESGYTPVLRGVFYMQGEADTFGADSSGAYRELLETLIYDMRSDLSEIAGYDCGELPFIYGRIHRNPGINPDTGAPYTDTTPYLTTVQAAQDAVDALGIKNVHMVDFRSDLYDPISGERKDPVQQDGWHYDSITQQMIGEAVIKSIRELDGEQTEYGFIPSQYTDAEANPFAIFKKVNGSYTFDSAKTKLSLAFSRARELTNVSSGTVDDVVILLRSDYLGRDYPENVSDIAGSVTLDLGGKTLTAQVSLGNTGVTDSVDSKGRQIKTVINIKNGTLLMSEFGVIFNAKGSDYSEYTPEKVFDYNFDNVYLGFCNGASGVTDSSKAIDLLVSDRTTSTVKNVRFNLNLKDCTLDMVTNAKAAANLGRLTTSNMTDVSMADYDIRFYGCTFVVNKLSSLSAKVSESGDSVRFMKGSDGSFGKIICASDLSGSSSLLGDCSGTSLSLAVKKLSASDGKYTHALIESGAVSAGKYGVIGSAYSDSTKYPFAVFYKDASDASYTFDKGYATWLTAINAASGKIKGSAGATEDDEAVILLRRDYRFQNANELFSSTTVMGGTLTVDLGGYTINYLTSIMNTTSADFSSGVGGSTYVNIKNGRFLSETKYGLIYNRTGAPTNYTVPKTYYFTFDNVSFGYTPSATAASLLIHSDASNMSTAGSIATKHVFTYNNCTVDMTGSPAGAVVANLMANSNYEKLNYELYFNGVRFLTDDVAKIAFKTNANGDSVRFLMDTEGNYPEVLIEKKYAEPSAEYKFAGEGNHTLSYCETQAVEGRYKVYKLLPGIDTKYGYIELADANKGFAVFKKESDGGYTFVGSYNAWSAAVSAAAPYMNASAPASEECVIYVTRDVTDSSYPENVSDLAGTLTVDLGGNTFVNKTTLFRTDVDDCMAAGEISQKKLTVNVINGELVFYNFGLLFATAGSGAYTTEKTFDFNIENVKFGYYAGASAITEANKGVDLLISDRSAPSSVGVRYNFYVENCIFDLITNARTNARLGNLNTTSPSKDNANSMYTVELTNCKFITDSISKVAFAKSASGDSVVMKNDANVGYPAVLIPNSANEFFTATFEGEESSELCLSFSGTEDGYGIYRMVKKEGEFTQTTVYGNISGTYVDVASYPFALFYKKSDGSYSFSKGYATYTEAMTAAIGLTKTSNAQRTSEAVILLRRDWANTSFPTGTSDVQTKITVDLNGYTLGALESLCNTATQDSLDPNGVKVATNGVIEYKNGKILAKAHGLIYAAKTGSSYTAGYEKTLTFNFNNVYIGFYEGASAVSLIGRVASNHTTAYNTLNVNFSSCTFDAVTNRSTNASFAFGNWTLSSDYTKVNTVYEDCSFIGKLESDMIAKIKAGNDSVIVKKSSSGNYASLTLPKSAAAPTATYTDGSGTKLSFVKISEDESTVTYRLRPSDAVGIDFTPKTSLTLDRNLVLNVYVPEKDFLLSFALDGETFESFASLGKAQLGSETYYHFEIPLDAKDAARSVVLKAKLAVGEKTANVTFTFGVIKYAEKILADGSDEEKTLVRDVLSYVRAAYVYFGSEDAEAMKKIDSILGVGYDAVNAPKEEGSTVIPTSGLYSATFVLDATPAMRFYLASGANAKVYKFYIDGKEVATETGTSGGRTYVDIDTYAYGICETVTYTVNGEAAGSFHIRAYYEWSKKQNNEDLANLAARFWRYSQSARAYRDSQVEN